MRLTNLRANVLSTQEQVLQIGILADIHEDVEALGRALAVLRRANVSRLVVLGDLFYDGQRVTETVELLTSAGAVGVWGNHDLGLCLDPDSQLLSRYPSHVHEYTKTLLPRMEVEGCLFSHGLPHWDAADPTAYYLGDLPESNLGRADSFAASECRVTFVGHFHRWMCATPKGLDRWIGDEAAYLDPKSRYLVTVAAVCDGWFAVYDTATAILVPYWIEHCRSE